MASSCARTAAGTSRSDMNGPPGARRIMKNVSVAIAHSVGIMSSTRRSRNVANYFCSAATSRPVSLPVAVDPHVRERMDVERVR